MEMPHNVPLNLISAITKLCGLKFLEILKDAQLFSNLGAFEVQGKVLCNFLAFCVECNYRHLISITQVYSMQVCNFQYKLSLILVFYFL